MEKMYELSHIGRAVDPRYPTNVAIMIWAGVIAVVIFGFRLVSGAALVDAGISAVIASLSVFWAWAMAREIDPQEQLSAFAAALLMTIAVFIVDVRFNLIVLFYMMSMTRILNRSVGLPATLMDSIALLVFTGVVGFFGSWIYAMMGATAFLLDSLLPDRDRKHLLFAGLSTVIMIVAFIMQNSALTPTLPTTEFIIGIVGVTFIFVPMIVKSRRVDAVCDVNDKPLFPIRVQAAQVIALLFGYHVALWQGNMGIVEFLPLWLTIAGVSLFPLVKPFVPTWDLSPRS